jgi:hypothetical protein
MRDLEATPDRRDKRAVTMLFDELADVKLIASRSAKELDCQKFSAQVRNVSVSYLNSNIQQTSAYPETGS